MADNLEAQLDAMLAGGSVSEGTYWNYYNDEKENFSPTIVGTVTKIGFSQEHQYQTHAPQYWPDGNPKLMYQLHIKDANNNEFLFDIRPKSSMMMEDFLTVCPNGNLKDLLGCLVSIEAQQPPVVNGQKIPFSASMRRKFTVKIIGQGQFPSEGVDTESYKRIMSRRQSAQAPAMQQVPPMAANVMGPQAATQNMYQQQQMNPRLQQAMRSAQAAGANMQRQIIEQQFPGATVMQMPAVDPNNPDLYAEDLPF